jgi:hypothetical protein
VYIWRVGLEKRREVKKWTDIPHTIPLPPPPRDAPPPTPTGRYILASTTTKIYIHALGNTYINHKQYVSNGGNMRDPRINMTISVSLGTYNQLHDWAEASNRPISRLIDALVSNHINGKNGSKQPETRNLDYNDSQVSATH